jgi:hypothetical protein
MLANCSEKTVYNILTLYHEYSQVNNPHARPRGCPRILDTGVLNYISSLLSFERKE